MLVGRVIGNAAAAFFLMALLMARRRFRRDGPFKNGDGAIISDSKLFFPH